MTTGHHADVNRLPIRFLLVVGLPPTMFLVVFYIWPFATLVGEATGFGAVADTFGRGRTWDVLWFTTWQAAISTVLTLVVGMFPTWAISRFSFPGRSTSIGVFTSVFVLPTVVIGAAFVAILPASLERSVWAILGAHLVFNLAVVIRIVGAVWEQLPDDLGAVAATLGASPWRTFRLITLPLLRPAAVAAGSIVFLFTFTSFGVIRILGTNATATVEVEVWRRATRLGDIGGAAVLAVLQLTVLAALVGASTVVQRRAGHRLRLERPTGRPTPTGRVRLGVATAVVGPLLLVVVPLGALLERSLRGPDGYGLDAWRALGNDEIRPGLRLGIDPVGALWRSLTTATWATLFSLAIGAAAVAAITTARRAGRLLDVGLMLPLGTSAVTIGFGMLLAFDTDPFDWRASWWIVPLGHALVAVPFVVRSLLGVVRSIHPDLRAAAAVLGAPPIRAWATAVVPAVRRPLIASAGLAAAISLGEFGATSFLSRSGADTVPLAIERLLARTGGTFQAQAFALAVVLAAATTTIVVLTERWAGARRR
ncbi:MAG: ABC transporter permease [Ilumatobacteraceae bacterium]